MLLRTLKRFFSFIRIVQLKYRNEGKISFAKIVTIPNGFETRIGGELCFKGDVTLNNGVYFGVPRGGTLQIGDGVYFGRNVIVAARGNVYIGDNCLFGPNVLVYDHDHSIIEGKVSKDKFKVSDVHIGNNCWIGAGTIILRGSIIGDNTIIGAGTIVKGKIPCKSIVYSKSNKQITSIQ